MNNRKLRMGMIGGGIGSMIGIVHRMAATMDNQIETVCGCFSRSLETSLKTAQSCFIPSDRVYATWEEMIEKEAQRSDRPDIICIVTPNIAHFGPAAAALDAGFHVVLDKPMCFSLTEALMLRDKVRESGKLLALTHVYTGYPALKEMRRRVAEGMLGKIRRVYVEYTQGWLSERIELKGGNNAAWRNDPKQAGKGGCTGDIATHAWHMTEYVTGAKVTSLCAQLQKIAEGRTMDDDACAFLRYDAGFSGLLQATQIATGEENNIRLRVYGDKAGMEWRQMEPNTVYMKWLDRPTEEIRIGRGYGWLDAGTSENTRVPGGHPEGFIEAFANIYRNFALCVRALEAGEEPRKEWLDFPDVEDGVRGMQFIETMVKAGYDQEQKWCDWVETE